MSQTLISILFATILISSCRNHIKDKISDSSVDFDTFPSSAYICFDRQEEGRRKKEFKLGDSCSSYSKYFDLNCDQLNNVTGFGQTLENRGNFGTTFTKIWFELDKQKRLYSFKAEWSHSKSSSNSARKEFYDIVRKNAMSCLWENSLNIYETRDTLQTIFSDNYIQEFISDFSGENWSIKYHCRLK